MQKPAYFLRPRYRGGNLKNTHEAAASDFQLCCATCVVKREPMFFSALYLHFFVREVRDRLNVPSSLDLPYS